MKSTKLTPKQSEFLKEIIDNDGFTCTVECEPKEWRTAKSLELKGLLKITGEPSKQGFFEVQLTDNL